MGLSLKKATLFISIPINIGIVLKGMVSVWHWPTYLKPISSRAYVDVPRTFSGIIFRIA